MSQRAVLGIWLAALLALPAPGWSQSQAASPGRGLTVAVVRGQGAVNPISGQAAPVVVEVRDEDEKPVSRAEVVFQLPTMGPSGTFYGWLRTHTTRTDEQGHASSAPFTTSNEEGRFEIAVTASAGGKQGTARISQSNSGTGAELREKKIT